MTTVNNSPDKNSTTQTLQAPPVCTEDDIYYFREGTNNRLYRWLGAHPCTHATQEGGKPEKGCWFAVWAPNAREVQVIGDFNGWQHGASPLAVRGDSSGIWEGFVPHASKRATPSALRGKSRPAPPPALPTSPIAGTTPNG